MNYGYACVLCTFLCGRSCELEVRVFVYCIHLYCLCIVERDHNIISCLIKMCWMGVHLFQCIPRVAGLSASLEPSEDHCLDRCMLLTAVSLSNMNPNSLHV